MTSQSFSHVLLARSLAPLIHPFIHPSIHSFIHSQPTGFYCVCPEEQHVCLGGSTLAQRWGHFSVFQRFLWMTDEVECRWRAFQADAGGGAGRNQMELSWNATIGAENIERYGTFLGLPRRRLGVPEGRGSGGRPAGRGEKHQGATPDGSAAAAVPTVSIAKHKGHVNQRETELFKDPAVMKKADEAYREMMAFSPEQLAYLEPVFF